MGQILSSDTVYAVAYLTERGRNYLFDPMGSNRFVEQIIGGNTVTVDLFKAVYFSMSDPDTNYNLTPGTLTLMATGDIPDISGKSEGCIKGTLTGEEVNLISYNGVVGGNVNNDPVDIPADAPVEIESTFTDVQFPISIDIIPTSLNAN